MDVGVIQESWRIAHPLFIFFEYRTWQIFGGWAQRGTGSWIFIVGRDFGPNFLFVTYFWAEGRERNFRFCNSKIAKVAFPQFPSLNIYPASNEVYHVYNLKSNLWKMAVHVLEFPAKRLTESCSKFSVSLWKKKTAPPGLVVASREEDSGHPSCI